LSVTGPFDDAAIFDRWSIFKFSQTFWSDIRAKETLRSTASLLQALALCHGLFGSSFFHSGLRRFYLQEVFKTIIKVSPFRARWFASDPSPAGDKRCCLSPSAFR